MSVNKEDKVKENSVTPENEAVDQNVETQQTSESSDQPLSETDKLSVELEELKVKYAELSNSHLRLMAEFDNFRKRTLKEKSDLLKYGGESTLVRVLPIIDDFERAMSALNSASEMKPVVEGIELIYTKFSEFLKQNSVSEIATENAVFDTEFHEAITTIPAPTEELKGKIIDCVQKGYMLNEKVIRFAKVVVGE